MVNLQYVHGSLIYKTTTIHACEVSEKNQLEDDTAIYIIINTIIMMFQLGVCCLTFK